MAEYIDKKMAIYSIESSWCMHCEKSNGVLCDECEHNIDIVILDGIPAADVQPVSKWRKFPDDIPPFDGDYLCYHKGFCNVYEFFHEKWFSESGEEVKQIDKDGLYWQDLPAYPKTIKG